jgi:o-succinylbenzoate synthase
MRAFRVPLRTRFRGVEHREGVLLHGPAGWGEVSPFADYPPQRAARWLAAGLEAAIDGWPAPHRDRIPVNVTVPAVTPEEAHALVAASSCTTAKVKVAERRDRSGAERPFADVLADDLARVEAVRDALGPTGRIRVDANGAWDVDEADLALTLLDRFTLEYAEQPVATLDGMAALRTRVEVPLAADESIRTAEDPLQVAGLEAADLVVLKVAPLGGVRAALEVAEACGLPVVVSSALETSVGLAAGLAFAAALPELPHACGLATADLLAADVVAEPFAVEDGHITVRRPEVDEAALRRVELDDAEAEPILRRIAEAQAHATAAGGRR